jgi:Cu2+-exporting ATPase
MQHTHHLSPSEPMRHHEHRDEHHTEPGGHSGNDRHAGSVAMFRDKYWLSLAFTIPVLVWSADVQHWLRFTAPTFPGSKWIPAIFGTVVFFYGGIVFVRGAQGELAERKPG